MENKIDQQERSRRDIDNAFNFPMEINQRFKNFLRCNWIGKTPEELSEIWSKENSKFPANPIKVVKYLEDMGFKISYGEVQKIKNLKKKEQEIMQESFDSSTKMLEKLKSERIKLMRLRVEQNKNIWSGMEYKIKVNFG